MQRIIAVILVAAASCQAAALTPCVDQASQAKKIGKAGYYQEAERMLTIVLTCAESSGDSEFIANVLTDLAVFEREQGHYSIAEKHFVRALDLFEHNPATKPPSLASALNNLATAKQANGQAAEAEALYKKSIEMWRRLPDEGGGLSRTLSNMAAFEIMQGDLRQAEKLLIEACGATAAKPRTLERASALNQLGVLYDKLGRPEAEETLRQALSVRQELMGPRNIETAVVISNLGHALESQRRLPEAEEMTRQAYGICKETLGASHRCVSMLNNLASIEERTGRPAEAEAHWKEAIAIYGSEARGYANGLSASLNNLGKLYTNQRRFADAQTSFERALAIWERANGDGSPDYASILTNLGALALEQNKIDAAEDYMRRALEVDQKALGPNHPRVALDCSNLGVVIGKRKKYKEAEELFQRSAGLYEKAYGARHPDVARQKANLGEMSFRQKLYARSAEQMSEAFAIWGERTGLPPAIEINLLEMYSFVLKHTEDFAGAEKAASRAMTLRVQTALHKPPQSNAMFN